MKDLTQELLGRVAQEEGTTVKKLYEEFDLDLED